MNIYNRTLWSHLKVPGATVQVSRKPNKPAIVFRVKNMIDYGRGKKTAVLENVAFPAYSQKDTSRKDLSLPSEIANLNLVCTSKELCAVSNVYAALKKTYCDTRMGPIVPDVLAPGDFLVFKQDSQNDPAKLSLALRMMPQASN